MAIDKVGEELRADHYQDPAMGLSRRTGYNHSDVGGYNVFTGGTNTYSNVGGTGSQAVEPAPYDPFQVFADPYNFSEELNRRLQSYQNQQIGGIDGNIANQDRAAQLEYLQQLQRDAQGNMNTPAQQQLRQQTQAAMGQAGSLASGMRNIGGGAAMRLGGQMADQAARQGLSNSQILSQQEMQQAAMSAANYANQMRQQDLAYQQANLGQQGQNASLNDSLIKDYTSMQQGIYNDIANRVLQRYGIALGVGRDEQLDRNRQGQNIMSGIGSFVQGLSSWAPWSSSGQSSGDNPNYQVGDGSGGKMAQIPGDFNGTTPSDAGGGYA